MRLDKFLVVEGYFESRNRAVEAIKSNKIKVDNKKAKASTMVDKNSIIDVEDEKFYVSRAGRKLESFLLESFFEEHPINLKDKTALDIGSSTGGFAQIVLENGAKSLHCVDVGTNQLHKIIKQDKRVTSFEQMDIRKFEPNTSYELITCDVSFISILQIIDDIDRLSQKNTDIIILYKPQFEVGKIAKRDSKGVVVDIDTINRKKEEFEDRVSKLNWNIIYQTTSKLKGKEGNVEYIYYLVKG